MAQRQASRSPDPSKDLVGAFELLLFQSQHLVGVALQVSFVFFLHLRPSTQIEQDYSISEYRKKQVIAAADQPLWYSGLLTLAGETYAT